jgi:two-component system chemotaxis response regulator CheY
VRALVVDDSRAMRLISFGQTARGDGGFAALRLIVVTTENGPEQVTRAIEAGADEYLMKPFTKESLRDKLVLTGFELVPS